MRAERGRCILCGTEHTVDRDVLISEESGEPTDNSEGKPFWEHAVDGMEATVCNDCHGDPDKIVAAHRLLTAAGAVRAIS